MLRLERTTGTGVAVLFAFEALDDFLGGGVGTFFAQVPTAFISVVRSEVKCKRVSAYGPSDCVIRAGVAQFP